MYNERISDVNLVKLKIKAKSLAAEAAIIRKEENKFGGMSKWDLQNHRKWNVRNETRATLLAIAWFKHRDYDRSEQSCRDEGKRSAWIEPRVITMINKYSRKGVERFCKPEFLGWVIKGSNTVRAKVPEGCLQPF